ncbi:MAG: pseudaminic acid synthase [Lachnospiraceae bacterium]|nr:pseudaminic acid synthase [Lachnospiraceae bacterium]
MSFRIKDRVIGAGNPAYIIAEMSANHAGSLSHAKEIIWAAKEAGADCIKIQTYTADTLTLNCNNEYFRIKSGPWQNENTMYALYGKANTPWEWHGELMAEANKAGIDFFSTPFDLTAVDFLEELGVEFYKIASPEMVDIPLIRYVASKGKPIIMSTGMATVGEIELAVNAIRSCGNDQIALLRCATAYPAVTDQMNLATLQNMSEIFNVPVGLSDHSQGSIGAVAAVLLGGSIIEKHFCISRDIESPDSFFSMNKDEFASMVSDIRQAEKARGHIQYGPMKQEEANLVNRKSIFCSAPIKKGEVFTAENVRVVRPGYGLEPKYYDRLIGSVALCDIEFGTPIAFGMFGEKL